MGEMNMRMDMLMGEGISKGWTLAFTGSTLSPTFSLPAGYEVDIDWGDEETSTIIGPVDSTVYTHTYAASGDYTIRFAGDVDKISLADFSEIHVSGNIAGLPGGLISAHFSGTAMGGKITSLKSGIASLRLGRTSVTGNISELPDGLIVAYLQETAITGNIANLPEGLQYARFDKSPVSGDTVTLPGSLIYAQFEDTSITATGLALMPALSGLTLHDNNWTGAQVDAVLADIYANRNHYTNGAPALSIGGTNAAPSGTYQYAATPSTGGEYIYALVNDDDAEGFNKWTISFTS